MRVLLLSGGIESTCIAFWKQPDLCVTIDYGQVCALSEIEVASSICNKLKISHLALHASPGPIKYGLLGVNKDANGVKPEFWPFRNQFLGTVAAMALYQDKPREIWFGSVRSDTRFLDGSRIFFKHFDNLVSQQEGKIRIKAPALALSTKKLIEVSKAPRSILGASNGN
jgi:7-cyano-7-deazaguanine synthase